MSFLFRWYEIVFWSVYMMVPNTKSRLTRLDWMKIYWRKISTFFFGCSGFIHYHSLSLGLVLFVADRHDSGDGTWSGLFGEWVEVWDGWEGWESDASFWEGCAKSSEIIPDGTGQHSTSKTVDAGKSKILSDFTAWNVSRFYHTNFSLSVQTLIVHSQQ